MGKKLVSKKIPVDYIDLFIKELKKEDKFQILPKSKNTYEVIRAQLNDSLIIIFSTGSITYHENSEIDKIVAGYLIDKHKKVKKKHELKPINVYLTNEQLIAFEKELSQFADEEESKGPGQKATFRYEGSNIILYNKGTVFSPKGHELFKQALKDVIEKIPTFTDFDIMIGQDEVGKGEIFGPIVVGSVALTQNQMIELQIEGIRDSKKVESNNIEKLANCIKRNSHVWCTKHASTDVFNKRYEEFKNESKTINDFLAWTHSIAIEETLKQLDLMDLGKKRILLIIDEFDRIKTDERIAKKIANRNIEVIQTPRAELQSIAVAAASIIAKNRRNQLIQDIEEEIGLELKIENIDDILLHSLSSKALKLSFVRSAQKKGTLPIRRTTIRGKEVDEMLMDILKRSDLECETLDFKEDFTKDATKIGNIICAFANTEGGYLFFGITNEEKKIVGIANVQKTEERIQGFKTNFEPKPIIRFTKLVTSESLELLRVEVIEAKDEPIAFRDKYYIRNGSSTDGISPKEMRVYWKKRGKDWINS